MECVLQNKNFKVKLLLSGIKQAKFSPLKNLGYTVSQLGCASYTITKNYEFKKGSRD